MSHLIEPHGGKLIDLMVTPERREELRELSREIPSWDLTPRQLCDLEILMTGGFSPLDGFMTRKDADSVASRMRLADGTLWPMPITLDVTEPLAARLAAGRPARAARSRGRDARRAPRRGPVAARPQGGGRGGLRHQRRDAPRRRAPVPPHQQHRASAGGSRAWRCRRTTTSPRCAARRPSCAHEFEILGWRKIVAFQTRNPMHRAHFELTQQAAQERRGQPAHPSRGGHDQARRPRPLHPRALLPGAAALLPAPDRAALAAAARDADGAGRARRCGTPSSARTTAAPTSSSAATTPARAPTARASRSTVPTTRRSWCASTQDELGIEMVPFQNMVYLENEDRYVPDDEVPEGRARAQHLGHRAAPAPGRGPRDPDLVHLPRGRHRAAPDPSAAPRAGLHRVLHRPLRRRQVDHRAGAHGQAARDGRPAGDAARRRPRAQEPLLRARLLEGAPRHQHPPHRLRRLRDHQERRHRDLRPDRSLRARAQGGARDDRAAAAASSWSTSRRRSRSASRATARASTPRRAPA